MAKVSVTVKISPPDGTWQTANELIKKVSETCEVGEELNIEVDGVFSDKKGGHVSAGNVFNFANMQNAATR